MDSPIRPLVQDLEKIEALDPVADLLESAYTKVVPGGVVKELLAGTWLGHTLHPALTDVPIGAWLSASMLDFLGGAGSRAASQRLIGLGRLAALPTAVTGVNDLADVHTPVRRVGALHGLGNLTALVLFSASYVSRRRGRHAAGVALSSAATAIALGTAYLGGHLSLTRGIGVNQTAFEEGPKRWTAVMESEQLQKGKPASAVAGTVKVMLYRTDDDVYAIVDRCSHLGGPLSRGKVHGTSVTCPWHGSVFDLRDGHIEHGPASAPQPAFDVREREGTIEVRARA